MVCIGTVRPSGEGAYREFQLFTSEARVIPERPSGRVERLMFGCSWGWLRQVGGVGRVRSTASV